MYSYIYRKTLSATGSLRHRMPAKKKYTCPALCRSNTFHETVLKVKNSKANLLKPWCKYPSVHVTHLTKHFSIKLEKYSLMEKTCTHYFVLLQKSSMYILQRVWESDHAPTVCVIGRVASIFWREWPCTYCVCNRSLSCIDTLERVTMHLRCV
jgi:hypothetical protein